MPRLGELLVHAGLLTHEQVEQGLRAQVVWGGRLGTNLVELHHLELDLLARALGRQHRLPAALGAHFEAADPALQVRLPAELAERLACVPLSVLELVPRTGGAPAAGEAPRPHAVIAVLDPLPAAALAEIAAALAFEQPERLVQAIAGELRIRYQLERVYGLRRSARFLRARGKTVPPFPAFELIPRDPEPSDPEITLLPATSEPSAAPATDPAAAPATEPGAAPATEPGAVPATEPGTPPAAAQTPAPPLDGAATEGAAADSAGEAGYDLGDDLAVAEGPPEDDASARERRRYVRTLADAPAVDADGHALGRIAIRKIAAPAPAPSAGATLGEATRAIRRSTARDRVADLVIDTLDRFAPACEAAILLVVRGATAIGWKGFCRRGPAIGELAVPIEDGGLVARAIELNATLRVPAGELAPLDHLLLTALGREDGDLLMVPIAIGAQVMCLLAAATVEGAPLVCAEPIAAAAGAALARLMRDASR